MQQEGITDSEGSGSKVQDPHHLEGPDRNYQVVALNLKEFREREHVQGELIRALYKKLGNVKLEGLVEAIDNMPIQKKMRVLFDGLQPKVPLVVVGARIRI